MNTLKLYAVATACFIISACYTMQRTDLFFGTDIPGGGQVSEQQWKNFSDSIIAVRFPEGYTEWSAQGRWLDTGTRHTITEHTKVVTLVGRKSIKRTEALNAVMQIYIKKYKQQAVMRLDSRVNSQFISAK